jgi:YidC/Oxa1 family membrane protein insertase
MHPREWKKGKDMDFIYNIFSYLLKGCLYISGNHYVLALLFFALVMQIVLLPLAIKQHKSQIKMAEIRPKEMAIREKYKGRNDRVTQQKMTMEIQEMYQKNGYSQFSGCLPLLIQLPIIIILFAIVRQPISYASNLTTENPNFIKDTSSAAVEYYQEQKEALIKENFETEEQYNAYVKAIEAYQQYLGGKEVENKTTENGLKIFEFNGEANLSNAEMVLSVVLINGREDIDDLVEYNRIDKSFYEVYDKYGFTGYAEQLPEYRIGSLNFLNTPDLNANIWLMIVPLLVFLTSFLQTKLTKRFSVQQTDANGNPIGGGLFMEVGMPLLSAVFAYNFAAAIGAYWIWRTLIGMVQTVVFAKAMPIPKITEEDIAEAKRELKAKQKKKKVITIEVDEDDTSYDDMIVEGGSSNGTKNADPTTRTPRRIEMLTADDEEESENE